MILIISHVIPAISHHVSSCFMVTSPFLLVKSPSKRWFVMVKTRHFSWVSPQVSHHLCWLSMENSMDVLWKIPNFSPVTSACWFPGSKWHTPSRPHRPEPKDDGKPWPPVRREEQFFERTPGSNWDDMQHYERILQLMYTKIYDNIWSCIYIYVYIRIYIYILYSMIT